MSDNRTGAAMLNFDEPRFLRIQSGAVGLAQPITAAVDALLDKGAANLFFLGTGGAGLLMQPAFELLRRRSGFPAYLERPAELVLTGHAALGPQSIVVIPSLSGTTTESLAVAEVAKARGAAVIAVTGHGDSPLAALADHALVNFAEDDTSCESFYLQSLILVLAVMRHRGEFAGFDAALAELARLPALLLEIKRAFEPQARGMAAFIAQGDGPIITAAGAAWPQAHYYGMCILEEMQWIRTRPVHASDFFHGTLELVEPGVSLIVLKGEDEARPLAERVERFADGHTDRLLVLDAAAFALPGISAEVRALISPVILATVLERVSAHLEVMRDHPLTTRRYYRRVAY